MAGDRRKARRWWSTFRPVVDARRIRFLVDEATGDGRRPTGDGGKTAVRDR
jgi:hypothetical protein